MSLFKNRTGLEIKAVVLQATLEKAIEQYQAIKQLESQLVQSYKYQDLNALKETLTQARSWDILAEYFQLVDKESLLQATTASAKYSSVTVLMERLIALMDTWYAFQEAGKSLEEIGDL